MPDVTQTELEQKESAVIGLNWLASKEPMAEFLRTALDFIAKTEDNNKLNEYAMGVQDTVYRLGQAGRDYEDFPATVEVKLPIPKENLAVGVNKFETPFSTILDPVIKLIEDYARQKGITEGHRNEISSLNDLLTRSKEKSLKVNMELLRTPQGVFRLLGMDLVDSSS